MDNEKFKEKKTEYLRNLKNYSEFISFLTKDPKDEMIIEVLIDPKTEKQLEFGIYYLMFIEETKGLIVNLSLNNIEKINLEESTYVAFLSNIINSLNNTKDTPTEEIKKIYETYMENNCELLAKIIYEIIVIVNTNLEELCKCICKRCNFDMEDEIQGIQFQILMNKVNKELKPLMMPENDEEINKFIAFVNHYHKYCISGVKNYFINLSSQNIEKDDNVLQFTKKTPPRNTGNK